MKNDPEFFVHDARQLPGGKGVVFDVAKISDGHLFGLLLRPRGSSVVYSTQRFGGYDIRRRSKAERAAWCRLTGATLAGLTAEVKRFEEESRARQHADQVEALANEARALGYALVEFEPAGSNEPPCEGLS